MARNKNQTASTARIAVPTDLNAVAADFYSGTTGQVSALWSIVAYLADGAKKKGITTALNEALADVAAERQVAIYQVTAPTASKLKGAWAVWGKLPASVLHRLSPLRAYQWRAKASAKGKYLTDIDKLTAIYATLPDRQPTAKDELPPVPGAKPRAKSEDQDAAETPTIKEGSVVEQDGLRLVPIFILEEDYKRLAALAADAGVDIRDIVASLGG